jgi:Zn-dependent protease with chaperone function
MPATYEALREMSLAAGIQPVPALHVFDTEVGVNAMVVGRRPETCAVAVSRGLTSEALATQRAVFASLLSRFHHGGLSWTTILAYLIWPLTGLRRAIQRAYDSLGRRSAQVVGTADVRAALAGLAAAVMFTSVLIALTLLVLIETPDALPVSVIAVFGLVASACLSATFVGFVLVAMFRGSHRTMVQSADAEGLLLLKDPRELSQALRDVILADNSLPHLKDLGFLAFTADDGTSDELADRLEALDAYCWEPL